MTDTERPTPPPEPTGDTVLANLIWLQKTRADRLADAQRDH